MLFPLIKPDQDFAIWAVVLGIAAFGFWCERFAWGRKYTGVMLLITLGIVLSNLRIIPTSAPVYDMVWKYLVPAAIPLLLFRANLKRILLESGPTLVAFLVATVGVVAGVLTGVAVITLGDAEAQLAGVFAGTYIGGSINFAGVSQAVGFQQGDYLTAAIAADNVATNIHFLVLLAIPGLVWVTRHYPTHHFDAAAAGEDIDHSGLHRIANLDIFGLIAALALAFGLAALGNYIAGAIGAPQVAILIITVLALLVGVLAPGLVDKLSGDYEAGNVLMFIFLATIGASADIFVLIGLAPILFLFAMIIVTVHMIILFIAGKFMKLDIAELIVASCATIGGPASAAALASAKGWRELVTPGVLVGSLGYAIGTFIGVGLFEWLS